MQMSFLLSMGHLMAYSGLQDLLEVVYAGNTVTHMMTGNAVSRTIHGHLLVDAALSSTLMADVYNVPVPTKDAVEAQTCDDETNEKETIDSVITDLTEAREQYMKTVIFTISGRCMFSRGIATNQKQTQQQEEKHDTPLGTVPGYDRYPKTVYKG